MRGGDLEGTHQPQRTFDRADQDDRARRHAIRYLRLFDPGGDLAHCFRIFNFRYPHARETGLHGRLDFCFGQSARWMINADEDRGIRFVCAASNRIGDQLTGAEFFGWGDGVFQIQRYRIRSARKNLFEQPRVVPRCIEMTSQWSEFHGRPQMTFLVFSSLSCSGGMPISPYTDSLSCPSPRPVHRMAPGVSDNRNSTFCIFTCPSWSSGTLTIECSAWNCGSCITSDTS